MENNEIVPASRLVPVFKNPKSLTDYYWDPESDVIYAQYMYSGKYGSGMHKSIILVPKYRLKDYNEPDLEDEENK